MRQGVPTACAAFPTGFFTAIVQVHCIGRSPDSYSKPRFSKMSPFRWIQKGVNRFLQILIIGILETGVHGVDKSGDGNQGRLWLINQNGRRNRLCLLLKGKQRKQIAIESKKTILRFGDDSWFHAGRLRNGPSGIFVVTRRVWLKFPPLSYLIRRNIKRTLCGKRQAFGRLVLATSNPLLCFCP